MKETVGIPRVFRNHSHDKLRGVPIANRNAGDVSKLYLCWSILDFIDFAFAPQGAAYTVSVAPFYADMRVWRRARVLPRPWSSILQ